MHTTGRSSSRSAFLRIVSYYLHMYTAKKIVMFLYIFVQRSKTVIPGSHLSPMIADALMTFVVDQ